MDWARRFVGLVAWIPILCRLVAEMARLKGSGGRRCAWLTCPSSDEVGGGGGVEVQLYLR